MAWKLQFLVHLAWPFLHVQLDNHLKRSGCQGVAL